MPEVNGGDGVPDDQEQGAGAARGADDLNNLLTFRPTFFRGTDNDAVTIQQWCTTIEKAMLAGAWSDQRTVDTASENLREEAATWYTNTKNGFRAERASVTTTWAAFKQAITNRFEQDRTATQKVNLIKQLHHGREERVTSFYERVHMAVRKSFGSIIDDHAATNPYATQPETSAFADGVEEVQKAVIISLFLAGLKDDIRTQLQSTPNFETFTLEDLRKHSIRIEDAKLKVQKEQPRMAIAAVTTTPTNDPVAKELKELKEKINAISGASKAKKGAKKPAKGAKPGGTVLPHQRTTWIRCHNCKQWGLHLARECKRTNEDIKKLTPQEMNPVPTGTPFDVLFPNPN